MVLKNQCVAWQNTKSAMTKVEHSKITSITYIHGSISPDPPSDVVWLVPGLSLGCCTWPSSLQSFVVGAPGISAWH